MPSTFVDTSTGSIEPERLEFIGKQAAKKFLKDGVSLNKAISETLHDTPDINDRQISRVVEFANIHAFDQLFQGEAEKNVEFDLASRDGVREAMPSDGDSGDEPTGPPVMDYDSPPVHYKEAASLEIPIEKLFPPTSGETLGEESPLHSFWSMHSKISGQVEHERSKLASLKNTLMVTVSDAAQEAQTTLAEGYTFGDVLNVIDQVSPNEKIAAATAGSIAEELMRRFKRDGDELTIGMSKSAYIAVNREHSLSVSIEGMVKVAEMVAETEGMLAMLSREEYLMDDFIKRNVNRINPARS